MDTLLAFLAALLSLRLAAALVRRHRESGQPELALWAAALAAYALAAAALAWGSAAGWDERAFRAYYLFGGLLTAALLGAGSLARAGWRRAPAAALLYIGLAVGVALAEPVRDSLPASGIPDAQDHLDLLPARAIAIAGNTLGTLAVVAVALLTFRRRPLGNLALLAGVGVAAVGSGLSGLGIGESAISFAAAAALLYAGFVLPGQSRESSQSPPAV